MSTSAGKCSADLNPLSKAELYSTLYQSPRAPALCTKGAKTAKYCLEFYAVLCVLGFLGMKGLGCGYYFDLPRGIDFPKNHSSLPVLQSFCEWQAFRLKQTSTAKMIL